MEKRKIMKKTYIIPFAEFIECEDLCKTGMNANSYDTDVQIVAEDQKDVYIENPEIEENPSPTPPINWDW